VKAKVIHPQNGEKPKKDRKLIADLPPGIRAYKLNSGYFRVYIGKKFSGVPGDTKDFRTLGECKEWIAEQTRDRVAIHGMQLTPDQISQAKGAFKRLGEIPLHKAVDYFFDYGPGGRKALRISEAWAEYKIYHAQNGSEPEYVDKLRTSIDWLTEDFKDCLLANCTGPRLNQWFIDTEKREKWGDQNTLNYVRDFRMFFRFCASEEFIGTNPMLHAKFRWVRGRRKKCKIEKKKRITIYTVAEVEKILNAALDNPKYDLLGYFVVLFFTGIRIDEMPKLTWERIRWDNRDISLTAAVVSKGGNPRHIEFTDAFEAWIDRVPNARSRTGLIVSRVNLRNRVDAIFKAAGVAKKRNAIRHGFASAFYIWSGCDAEATRKRLGQTTEQVLFDSYVSLLEKKDANAFWALRPPLIAD
jgi:integrase